MTRLRALPLWKMHLAEGTHMWPGVVSLLGLPTVLDALAVAGLRRMGR